MTPCYKCDERCVWYDDDGKAHRCHETCERYAEYRVRVDKARNRKDEIVRAETEEIRSRVNKMGKYKWNVRK